MTPDSEPFTHYLEPTAGMQSESLFLDAIHVELATENTASFLRDAIRSEFDLIPSQPLEKYDLDRPIKHPCDRNHRSAQKPDAAELARNNAVRRHHTRNLQFSLCLRSILDRSCTTCICRMDLHNIQDDLDACLRSIMLKPRLCGKPRCIFLRADGHIHIQFALDGSFHREALFFYFA